MKKIFMLFALVSALAILFGDTASAADGVLTEISIGGCGYPRPYQWLDETGHLQGYDIAVAEEIAKRAGLRLRWENTEFPALFLGIDANRYQVIVGDISYTKERAEKYLYPKEYYSRQSIHIVVAKGRNQGIKSVEDLSGKRIPFSPNGTTNSAFLEHFNETHPDAPIDLVYTDDPAANKLLGLFSGIYDVVIATELSVKEAVASTGQEFEIIYLPEEISEQIMPGKGYFVFGKDSQELADKFDAALRSMIDDGKLRSIALEILGVDFSR